MRQGLQSLATAEVFVDEYAGLEEDTKQAAILKWQEQDCLKEEKIAKDAEKAAAKEGLKRKRAAAKVAAKETQRKEKRNETNNCNVDAPASSVDNTSRIQVCATTGLPL